MVVTDETEMEGVEYRKKLVRKLCLERWAPNDAVNRVKMFKDVVDLNPEELDLVVEKACTVASKMASQNPMDIPPLVFQVSCAQRFLTFSFFKIPLVNGSLVRKARVSL